MDFSKIETTKKAIDFIPDRQAQWLTESRKFYQGDHWQKGAAWIGPQLDPGHSQHLSLMAEVRRAFVSKNSVKEVVDRHVGGVVGREPAWQFTPARPLGIDEQATADELTLIATGEAALRDWWDQRGVHEKINQAVTTMLYGRRAVLRLFVPAASLVETKTGLVIPRGTLPESLGRIYLQVIEPDQATVYTDPDTQQQVGIFVYEKNKQTFAELTYLDPTGQTVIRIIGPDKGDTAQIGLPLYGRLPMYELDRDRFVTDPILQNQKLINLALTMMQRNVVLGGFLERVFLNAQLPGRVEIDDETGAETFIPEPHYVGAGATSFIGGMEIPNADGTYSLTTPQALRFDPVPVATFTDTKDTAHANILEEADQLHSLISGDATASGESRRQAMTDYEQSLNLTKSKADRALRWVLGTALQMAATFSSRPDQFVSIRPVADCKLFLGPRSSEDRKVDMEQVDKRIISKQTARQRDGVEDTDAEAQQVTSEAAAEAEQQQTSLAKSVMNAQASLNAGQQSTGLESPDIGAK